MLALTIRPQQQSSSQNEIEEFRKKGLDISVFYCTVWITEAELFAMLESP